MLNFQFSACLMLLLVRLLNISFLFQIVWFGWAALFFIFVWNSLLGSSLLSGFDYSYGALHSPCLYVNLFFVLFFYMVKEYSRKKIFFFFIIKIQISTMCCIVWLKFYICMNHLCCKWEYYTSESDTLL